MCTGIQLAETKLVSYFYKYHITISFFTLINEALKHIYHICFYFNTHSDILQNIWFASQKYQQPGEQQQYY
jgi:hypothetical protein